MRKCQCCKKKRDESAFMIGSVVVNRCRNCRLEFIKSQSLLKETPLYDTSIYDFDDIYSDDDCELNEGIIFFNEIVLKN